MRQMSQRLRDVGTTGGNALPVPTRMLGRARWTSIHFPHLCQLWKPVDGEALEGIDRNPTGLSVRDRRYVLATPEGREGDPAAAVYPCCWVATPETDPGAVMGRTKDDNIFTLDKFLFPSGIPIRDSWAILFLTPGDNYGEVQIVQGNPQSENTLPFVLGGTSGQLVYVKQTPTPPTGMTLDFLSESDR
jgi:hypothetical protein